MEHRNLNIKTYIETIIVPRGTFLFSHLLFSSSVFHQHQIYLCSHNNVKHHATLPEAIPDENLYLIHQHFPHSFNRNENIAGNSVTIGIIKAYNIS